MDISSVAPSIPHRHIIFCSYKVIFFTWALYGHFTYSSSNTYSQFGLPTALISLFIYSVITNCSQYSEKTLEPNSRSVSIAKLRLNWIFFICKVTKKISRIAELIKVQ
jgi:hypothetical protein